jgi:hypothetical protein
MANVKTDTREDRLKAALRANLKRRKAQSRGREEAGGDPSAPDPRGAGVPKGHGE